MFTPAPPSPKHTRQQIAIHCSLSVRTIDELTHNGTLPHYKIGKSVRYDLAEVQEALRERFHIRAKVRKSDSKGSRTQSPAA